MSQHNISQVNNDLIATYSSHIGSVIQLHHQMAQYISSINHLTPAILDIPPIHPNKIVPSSGLPSVAVTTYNSPSPEVTKLCSVSHPVAAPSIVSSEHDHPASERCPTDFGDSAVNPIPSTSQGYPGEQTYGE